MDNFPMFIFFTFIILIFFGFSISAMVIWIKSFKKTKEILRDINHHWSFKFVIYYGIYFTMLIVAAIFVSLIVGLSFVIWSPYV